MTEINHQRLKNEALARLSGNWSMAVVTVLVYVLILSASGIVPFGSLLIGGPMSLGFAIFFLHFSRGRNPGMEDIFEGFKDFGRATGAYLLRIVFVSLWTLLFIIPGIVKALAYSQVFFILADDKSISAMDALRESEAIMDGYKWDYFWLSLSFIGWAFLCVLTFGIGYLWLIPYMQMTYARFYDTLRGEVSGNLYEEELLDSDLI